MPMHGQMSNKRYVQRCAPFMKAESRIERVDVRRRRVWFLYDSRSGKIWGGPYRTEATGWRELAANICKNGGTLINHGGQKAIVATPAPLPNDDTL